LAALSLNLADLTEFSIRDMLSPFEEASMCVRTTRFGGAALLTGLDIVVLCQYGEVVWKAWPRAQRLSAMLLLAWALSTAILWLHVYRDLRSALAERRLSSLSDSSTWRDGTDV
jgi:hypothetical protein